MKVNEPPCYFIKYNQKLIVMYKCNYEPQNGISNSINFLKGRGLPKSLLNNDMKASI